MHTIHTASASASQEITMKRVRGIKQRVPFEILKLCVLLLRVRLSFPLSSLDFISFCWHSLQFQRQRSRIHATDLIHWIAAIFFLLFLYVFVSTRQYQISIKHIEVFINLLMLANRSTWYLNRNHRKIHAAAYSATKMHAFHIRLCKASKRTQKKQATITWLYHFFRIYTPDHITIVCRV